VSVLAVPKSRMKLTTLRSTASLRSNAATERKDAVDGTFKLSPSRIELASLTMFRFDLLLHQGRPPVTTGQPGPHG
jgi:hypothetical protein